MKVKIDKEKCIGCGSCEAISSEVFSFDDENNKASVKKSADFEKNKSDIMEAREACPVEAIEVI